MIVLDTNVVSEAMKPKPHPAVRAWLNDALNLLRLNKRSKLGVKNKRLRAPYDDDFRAEVLNFK